MRPERVPLDPRIAAFCQKWRVAEFALFGSILRDDFGPNSDVDVLVAFAPDAPWSYWGYPQMEAELESIFGRRVDLVEKQAITNPYRRHKIVTTRKVLYRAA